MKVYCSWGGGLRLRAFTPPNPESFVLCQPSPEPVETATEEICTKGASPVLVFGVTVRNSDTQIPESLCAKSDFSTRTVHPKP